MENFETKCNNYRNELKDTYLKYDLKFLREHMWPWIGNDFDIDE
jgi:hypothetical protein